MSTQEKRILRESLLSQAQALGEDIAREERDCQHVFDDAVYDPESYQEAIFDRYESRGSDPEPIYHYQAAIRPRWSRTCTKCGKKEYTYYQKPVAHAPDFDNHCSPPLIR